MSRELGEKSLAWARAGDELGEDEAQGLRAGRKEGKGEEGRCGGCLIRFRSVGGG